MTTSTVMHPVTPTVIGEYTSRRKLQSKKGKSTVLNRKTEKIKDITRIAVRNGSGSIQKGK